MGLSLADAVRQAEERGGRRLVVDVILDELDETDAVTLRDLLSSHVVPKRIADALSTIGHPVSEGAIRTWRSRNVAR